MTTKQSIINSADKEMERIEKSSLPDEEKDIQMREIEKEARAMMRDYPDEEDL
jgi:hypothetical protein